jgi:hypothetical protein
VDTGELSDKVVELPKESVIIEGALTVKIQFISFVVIADVVIAPFSIVVPLPSSKVLIPFIDLIIYSFPLV